VLFDAESVSKVGATTAGPKRRGGARSEIEGEDLPKSEGIPPELLSLPPSPDHALAYSVFDDCGVREISVLASCCKMLFVQVVVIALATLDSELYAAFPGTV
jgi:hypothetical protein